MSSTTGRSARSPENRLRIAGRRASQAERRASQGEKRPRLSPAPAIKYPIPQAAREKDRLAEQSQDFANCVLAAVTHESLAAPANASHFSIATSSGSSVAGAGS